MAIKEQSPNSAILNMKVSLIIVVDFLFLHSLSIRIYLEIHLRNEIHKSV
jgi:hypothetical protein